MMARFVFGIVDSPEMPAAELERQVTGAFAFGMISACGQSKGLTPTDVHAIVLIVLKDVFRYDSDGAVAFAEVLIKSTNPEHHRNMNAIIHRGIDGHHLWSTGSFDQIRDDVHNLVAKLRTTQ